MTADDFDAAALADSPYHFYKFDEASGSLIDYGSAGRHLTWGGQTRRSRTVGPFENVADFNVQRFVDSGGLNNTGWTSHTIEYVIVLDTVSGSRTVVAERHTSGSDDISVHSGYGVLGSSFDMSTYDNAWTSAKTTTPIAAGEWHHVVGVHDYSAQTLTIYLDGDVEATTGSAPKVPDVNEWYIGGRHSSGSAELDGALGRLAIYDSYAMSAATVASRYLTLIDAWTHDGSLSPMVLG